MPEFANPSYRFDTKWRVTCCPAHKKSCNYKHFIRNDFFSTIRWVSLIVVSVVEIIFSEIFPLGTTIHKAGDLKTVVIYISYNL